MRDGGRMVERANEQQAEIHFGFVKSGLKVEHGFVLGDCLGVFFEEAIGKRQMEVRAVVLRIRSHGLGEQCSGFFVFLGLQRLHPVGLKVGSLREKGRQQDQHTCTLDFTCYRAG